MVDMEQLLAEITLTMNNDGSISIRGFWRIKQAEELEIDNWSEDSGNLGYWDRIAK